MKTRTALLAATALVALIAGPIAATRAQAPAPSAKGEAAVAPGTCTPTHLAAIAEGFADARDMTARAIQFLEERPTDPHVTRFFGATPRKVLVENYRIIAEAFGRRDELDLRCEDQRVCGTGGRPMFAALITRAQRAVSARMNCANSSRLVGATSITRSLKRCWISGVRNTAVRSA